MDIHLYEGDDASLRRSFEQGLKLEPKSFIMREKFLGTLTSRWGGSLEEMRAFVDESRAAGLDQRQMARLNAQVIEEEAWLAEHRNNDPQAALALHARAALVSPETACLECGPEFSRAALLRSQKKYAEAIEIASRALARDPMNVPFLNLRANLYQQLRRGADAEADYKVAIRKGDPRAATELAKMLLVGELIPEDRERALMLLERAARKNYPEAEKLRDLASNYSQKFVSRPD
jgi:tetratricopeptide (TPR) repeat protein